MLGEGGIRPSVPLKRLFEGMSEYSYEAILKSVIEIEEAEKPDVNIGFLENFETAKESLFPVLTSKENLREGTPFTTWNDLYVQYRAIIEVEDDGLSSTLITDKLMNMWGIDVNQLDKEAMSNGPKILPYELEDMSIYVRQALIEQGIPDATADILAASLVAEHEMYALTNKYKNYGAGTILYPYVLAEIGLKLGGDFYLIPSSIHEWLVFRIDEELSDWNNSIEACNTEMLKPEERLSGHMYKYLVNTKEVISL